MQTAVAGAADALQGRAAGVEVVNSNGSPGSNTEVRIRGLGSINGSPVLYVVDGMPKPVASSFIVPDILLDCEIKLILSRT